MTKKLCIRLTAFISAIFLAVMFVFSATASATEPKISLTLICRKANTILTGMDWRLYHVGQRVGDNYVLNDDFKNYSVEMDVLSTESMNKAAATLENYAVVDRIAYMNSGKIDENGYLIFPDLDAGLYLVSGTIFNIGDVYYHPSPSLVELNPMQKDENVEIVVYPKVRYALLSEVNLNNTVKKIWKDNKTEHDPVTIEIFRNTELYKKIELNSANNWTFNWKAVDAAEWRVKESVVPKDYAVSYQSDNGKFAIENTFIGKEEPPVTTATPKPVLPQTGQLWWPVTILGGGGIILLLIGIRLKLKKTE